MVTVTKKIKKITTAPLLFVLKKETSGYNINLPRIGVHERRTVQDDFAEDVLNSYYSLNRLGGVRYRTVQSTYFNNII